MFVHSSSGIDALLERMTLETDVRQALYNRAGAALVERVNEELLHFPFDLACDENESDLPHRRTWSGREQLLFPLGEFRHVWLGGLSGRTTLYIARGGLLFEYGPGYTSQDALPSAVAINQIALRQVAVISMSFADLRTCLELLQRVWI